MSQQITPTVGIDSDTIAPRPSRPQALTSDRAVAKYLELRDKIAQLKKEQAAAMAPFTAALELVGNWLMDDLNQSHVESMRAEAGTFYKSIRTSAKVEDWGSTLAFIQAQGAWELLEARVSKLAVAAIMEETQQTIPGVSVVREIVINVRKA